MENTEIYEVGNNWYLRYENGAIQQLSVSEVLLYQIFKEQQLHTLRLEQLINEIRK